MILLLFLDRDCLYIPDLLWAHVAQVALTFTVILNLPSASITSSRPGSLVPFLVRELGLASQDSWPVSGSQAWLPQCHFTLLWRAVLYVPLVVQAENQI